MLASATSRPGDPVRTEPMTTRLAHELRGSARSDARNRSDGRLNFPLIGRQGGSKVDITNADIDAVFAAEDVGSAKIVLVVSQDFLGRAVADADVGHEGLPETVVREGHVIDSREFDL